MASEKYYLRKHWGVFATQWCAEYAAYFACGRGIRYRGKMK